MTDDNLILEPDPIEEAPKPAEDDLDEKLPEKFKGKSPLEIVEMYSNLESDYGRRGNEIGQLRRLTDELLGFRKEETAKPKVEEKPLTADDLLNDPSGTITAAAKRAAEEATAKAEARVAALEGSLYEQAFEKKHPGYKNVVQDPEFLKFVGATEYRKQLVVRAAQNDWAAADELMTLYGEVGAKQKQDQKDDSVEAARAATTVKSGGSSASGVTPKSGGDGKKVYSREALIQLRINNPDEYDRRYESEFLPAYREKRVR